MQLEYLKEDGLNKKSSFEAQAMLKTECSRNILTEVPSCKVDKNKVWN